MRNHKMGGSMWNNSMGVFFFFLKKFHLVVFIVITVVDGLCCVCLCISQVVNVAYKRRCW